MIGCQLNHLFIIFGTQIHEIIIDRIHYLPFHVHFIMQMRTGTFSCTTHFSDNLTTYHFLSDFRIKSLQVSIPSEIPEAMIYLNGITVSGFLSHFHHCSVSGSIYIRSRMSGKVKHWIRTDIEVRRNISCKM